MFGSVHDGQIVLYLRRTMTTVSHLINFRLHIQTDMHFKKVRVYCVYNNWSPCVPGNQPFQLLITILLFWKLCLQNFFVILDYFCKHGFLQKCKNI